MSAGAFNLENRTGSNRQLIYGPISSNLYGSHLPTGENSLVALGSDGSTILWGANWQDAFRYYRGTSVSASTAGASVSMLFGQFPLGTGQAAIIDPVFEGGGGGGGTPTVSISTPSISEGGATATLTWSDSPSTACDVFQWGTSTSYGNTINTCSHTVTLSNLQTGVLYYYQITACASGYYCGTYSSSFYPARQLLGNPWFQTTSTSSQPTCAYYATGTSSQDGCQNYPWQGNYVAPWSDIVFQIGGNGCRGGPPSSTCCEQSALSQTPSPLTSYCYTPYASNPYQYVINPYYAYQVKGNLDNSYQDPGYLWVSSVSQGCGFPWYGPVSGSTTTWSYPSNTPISASCPNDSPSWTYSPSSSPPHRQNLLDPNQYFTTTVSRTAPAGRSQTLAAWWIGWGIVNVAVDFFVLLDNPATFYAPDSCGNYAWRTSNLLELEVYLYMGSATGANQPLWGNFPVGSSPVVVAISGSPVTPTIFGCQSSAPYWIYVRTHPIQIDACYPTWCPQFTYTTMRSDILSAESNARISPVVDGTMMNFQIGIEAANFAMLWWATDTEWWGSG